MSNPVMLPPARRRLARIQPLLRSVSSNLAAVRPCAALRSTLAEGYTREHFKRDAIAGLVVGLVALPLSMALAIASGVPPQHGLYTAIVAGGLIAATGGSRTNVSGPTAAFVVLLAPISARYGIGGLALASLMAGIILIVAGIARLGRLVQYVPHPVTTGFTAGIAVVIATLQLRDLFGLTVNATGEHYWNRVADLVAAAPTVAWPDAAIGALALGILLLWPRVTRRIPAPLVAMFIAALAAWALARMAGIEVATLGSRFSYTGADGALHGGIPQVAPMPVLPWHLPGADGTPLGLSWSLIVELAQPAFAIAALGAIESLLSAVIADGMAGTRHDPDAELLGQGIGNVVGPFFGALAATGAIARTATNIRSGGRSPIAALVHALVLLGAILGLAPLLAWLPMAAMAALLLIVAWNMSDARHFVHVLRVAPRSDVTILLVCFALTVLFDMVVAVSVGIVLAALLFMRRMAEITGSRLIEPSRANEHGTSLPQGTILYEIAGPLFFGASEKALGTLHSIAPNTRKLILDVHVVPAIDATALVALETVAARAHTAGASLVLLGLQEQPRRVIERAGLLDEPGITACETLEEAIAA